MISEWNILYWHSPILAIFRFHLAKKWFWWFPPKGRGAVGGRSMEDLLGYGVGGGGATYITIKQIVRMVITQFVNLITNYNRGTPPSQTTFKSLRASMSVFSGSKKSSEICMHSSLQRGHIFLARDAGESPRLKLLWQWPTWQESCALTLVRADTEVDMSLSMKLIRKR